MATRFVKEGVNQILLGSRKSPDLEKFLPPDIKIASQSNPSDSDVHLVIEYPSGDSWGRLSSPRANRFIVHSDKSNPMIRGMEEFHDQIAVFHPDLFVVSGLQMLDNFPFSGNEGTGRVDKLAGHIQDLKMNQPSVKVHFEMASFTDVKLMTQIVNDIIPFVDSLGMNEQELPNLRSIFTVGNVTLVSDSYPRTAVVLDQMRDVFRFANDQSGGRISRIHVHTLAFQAVLIRKGSDWKNTRAAATKSALTAHRHTCGSDVIDVAKARLIMDDSFTTTNGESKLRIQFDPKYPVPCWEETIANAAVEICIAPVLVCTRVLLTAGGGDNVSAAGLVVQL
jgi:ADP-dependent glucokinase